jgi:hypothetical protein
VKKTLDLMREVLDHEIVDVHGVSCGMVDDIAFAMRRDGVPVVEALIAGPRAWSARTPALLSWIVRWIIRAPVVHVPWSAVAHVSETIELRVSAESLGLGRTERRIGRWLARIPGA